LNRFMVPVDDYVTAKYLLQSPKSSRKLEWLKSHKAHKDQVRKIVHHGALLPESCVHGCYIQKTLFPGPAPHARRGVSQYVLGPCGALMRRGRAAGVGATPWVPRGGAWHRGWAEAVGRVLFEEGRTWGVCGPDRATWFFLVSELDMCGRLGWCGVRWIFPGCCSSGCLGPWSPAA